VISEKSEELQTLAEEYERHQKELKENNNEMKEQKLCKQINEKMQLNNALKQEITLIEEQIKLNTNIQFFLLTSHNRPAPRRPSRYKNPCPHPPVPAVPNKAHRTPPP
jgi:hypothetical protein